MNAKVFSAHISVSVPFFVIRQNRVEIIYNASIINTEKQQFSTGKKRKMTMKMFWKYEIRGYGINSIV